jgi:glycosyltransferase involved in cell wall biosynthesis
MPKYLLNLPVNGVSFGQTSILLLRTIFDNKYEQPEGLFPIGNIDLSTTNCPHDFKQWIDNLIKKAFTNHNRDIPCFKLWHLNPDSLQSVSDRTLLMSFYELDAPTPLELNVAKNNETIFTSEYTSKIFQNHNIESQYMPLGFDSYHFSRLNKKYFDDGRIVFNVVGKFEKRKHHAKVISAWIKKYGGNPKYFLQCAVFNPFFENADKQYKHIVNQLTRGQRIFNVNFLGHMVQNSLYNDFLNSADIVIGMSGGEGWGLPEFQSVAIGKHSVIMDAHGYKGWATKENSVLVSPCGKIDATDGFFFQKGAMSNQGNIFDFNEEEFLSACDKAIERVNLSRVNTEGLKLQEKFSKEKFVENILLKI